MAHHEHTHSEEKKSINFLGPVIGGLLVWLIALIIETNLDEKPTAHQDAQTTHTEQSHH